MACKYKNNKYAKFNRTNDLSWANKIFNQFIVCCLILLVIFILSFAKTDSVKKFRFRLKTELTKNILTKNNIKKFRDISIKNLKFIYHDLLFELNNNKNFEIDNKLINKIQHETKKINLIKKNIT